MRVLLIVLNLYLMGLIIYSIISFFPTGKQIIKINPNLQRLLTIYEVPLGIIRKIIPSTIKLTNGALLDLSPLLLILIIYIIKIFI